MPEACQRVLLVNGLRPESSDDLYADVAERLRTAGLRVDVLTPPQARGRLADYNLVFSNMQLDAPTLADTRVIAGKAMSRPASLRLMETAGVPTMDWALPRTRREVLRLFDRWNCDRLLLKPSFTFGGTDIRVFERRAIWRARWSRADDVFCREVNVDEGDIYKVELLAGQVLIAWKSAAPPIRSWFSGGHHRGILAAYGERELWEPPTATTEVLQRLSDRLTTDKVGHVSVDLMRDPAGCFRAIELNPRGVATWWTRQFPSFRERYADQLLDLVTTTRALKRC